MLLKSFFSIFGIHVSPVEGPYCVTLVQVIYVQGTYKYVYIYTSAEIKLPHLFLAEVWIDVHMSVV